MEDADCAGMCEARLFRPVREASAAGMAKGIDLSIIPPDCDGSPPFLLVIAAGPNPSPLLSDKRPLLLRLYHRRRNNSTKIINAAPAIEPTTLPTRIGVGGVEELLPLLLSSPDPVAAEVLVGELPPVATGTPPTMRFPAASVEVDKDEVVETD